MQIPIRVVSQITAFLLGSVLLAQEVPGAGAAPVDPLELARGSFHVVKTPDECAEVIAFLQRARDKYRIADARVSYELKVSFVVDSGGEIQYDGAWKYKEIRSPDWGARWTATADAGYSTTRIDSNGLHAESSSEYGIPLALQESIAYSLEPMGSLEAVPQQQFRISPAVLEGVPLTCVLHSDLNRLPESGGVRHWSEMEDCIENGSGRLRMHSLVPGWYAYFDYSQSSEFHGRELAQQVTIFEAGKREIVLQVDSLKDIPNPSPAMFKPDELMQSPEPSVEMGESVRFSYPSAAPFKPDEQTQSSVPSVEMGQSRRVGQMDAAPKSDCGCKCNMPPVEIRRVLVFGLRSASGRVVDAHSLQPLDPNSALAVQTVSNLPWAPETSQDGRQVQRMVAVSVEFTNPSGPVR